MQLSYSASLWLSHRESWPTLHQSMSVSALSSRETKTGTLLNRNQYKRIIPEQGDLEACLPTLPQIPDLPYAYSCTCVSSPQHHESQGCRF